MKSAKIIKYDVVFKLIEKTMKNYEQNNTAISR